MRALAWTLLLLAPLAFAAGGAQAADGAGRILAAEPSSATLPAGESLTVTLTVHNPLARPVTLALGTTRTPLEVSFGRAEVALAPDQTDLVRATIRAPPGLAPGGHPFNFTARDATAAGAAPVAQAPFALKVTAPLAADGAKPLSSALPLGVRVLVEPQEVDLSLGGHAILHVVVRNGGRAPWTPELRFELPAGVGAAPALPPAPVPAGGSADVPILLTALPGAEAGESAAAVVPADLAVAPARFRLRVVEPPAVVAQEEPPREEPTVPVGVVAAGAAAAGGGMAAALALRRRWPFLLAALYTRLRPSRVLDQPTRERLAHLVHEDPGVSFSELARRLDLGAGTLTYHARVLERSGVIFSARDGQQRRFFPVSSGRVAGQAGLAERALAALAGGPRSLVDLARELGVSRQALHYHLKRLAREGRVVAHGAGRDVRFAASA